MKKLCALILGLALTAGTAYAESQTFGNISLNVADGWAGRQIGNTLALMKNDMSASMTVSQGETGDRTIPDLAHDFALRFGGTAPKKNDTGGYEFTFRDGASHAVFSGDNGAYVLIVMTNIKNAPDDFLSMLHSMKLIKEVKQEEQKQ